MALTYPLTIGYNEAMGLKENPLSFASLQLVDLRNGQSQYLSTMKQLVDALLKTVDPASCFALRGHISRPGQSHLRHSMVLVAFRRDLPPRLHITSILLDTPGTACSLTRG